MKKRIVATVVFIYMCLFYAADAQQLATQAVREDKGSYPIPGSHLLWRDDQMVRDYFSTHPDAMKQMRLAKTTAWNFVPGSTHSWKSVNTTNNSFFDVPSTCRAVGTHCYIFVEDSSWGTSVTQAAVDSVKKAFDQSTPANPAKGIYDTDVDTFGGPPDVDNDARIIILIMNIQDGFSGSGGYVAGYFHSVNELPVNVNPNSNAAEIYYIDCNPQDLKTQAGLVSGMSTTAHEFQHMIHWNYDKNEITFINEGCSMFAQVNAGYPLSDQTGFTTEANHYLFDWRFNDNVNVLRDYSRASLYTLFLHDQFTTAFFKPLVQSTATGAAGVDVALLAVGSALHFTDALKNWFVANIVNNKTVNPAYGYTYPGVTNVVPQIYFNPNVPSTGRAVQNLAADYISFRSGSNLSVTFALPNGSSLLIKAVKKGSGTPQVVDVAPGTPFTVPEFGSSVTEVAFVVMNTNPLTVQNYTFQSSGTAAAVELKYDVTEPTGYLLNAPGDTVCVWFHAAPGARLDSVRVAIRRAGSMNAGVWKYTGSTRPTPLGAPLATGLTATVTSTPGFPYPVPWPNWGTIDLRSKNIIANDNFAVALLCEGIATSSPRVMITGSPTPNEITSLTYSSGSVSPNWYYFTSNTAGDSVQTYLIRAYLSFVNSSGVKEKIELAPNAFVLGQNYPNPFNPSTTIRYSLPNRSTVRLVITNTLGQEVALLRNGEEEAGFHDVEWHANVASGVYFYHIDAISVSDPSNRFVQVKKMLLVR